MFNQREGSDTLGPRDGRRDDAGAQDPGAQESETPSVDLEALAPHVDRPVTDPDPKPEDSARRRRPFRRSDVYGHGAPVGHAADDGIGQRIARWIDGALTGSEDGEEARLDAALLPGREVGRSNIVSVVSPKGGVGKTTCTFLLGNVLSDRLRLRCVAIDANPDFGTLGSLAPDGARPRASLADLLSDLDKVTSVAGLSPYMASLPTGLDMLCAPGDAEEMAKLDAEMYRQLTGFLGRFYEVILLDLGTGITDPLAEFGIGAADQIVLVTTPEWVTSRGVLDALRHIDPDGTKQIAVALNLVDEARGISPEATTAEFARQRIERHAAIPHDPRLRLMLDSATYRLEGLRPETRIPIKQLAVTVADRLDSLPRAPG